MLYRSLVNTYAVTRSKDDNDRRFIYSQLYSTYLRKSTMRAKCTLKFGHNSLEFFVIITASLCTHSDLSSCTHMNSFAHALFKLWDPLMSQAGFVFQSMKIQYTGMPDRIMIMPIPTSHGET